MLPPDAARVGYVVKVYPRFSETFVVTEVLAREAQGEAFDSAAFESMDNKRRVLETMVDEQLLDLVAERQVQLVQLLPLRHGLCRVRMH